MSQNRANIFINGPPSISATRQKPKHNLFTLNASQPVPVQSISKWEGNLPNNKSNFKTFHMYDTSNEVLETNRQKDKWCTVYMILVLHGIGILMPWNMFINAKSYFLDYKLGKDYLVGEYAIDYASIFMLYLTINSQLPNLLFNWLNIYFPLGGKFTTRTVWSILIEVVCFVFTITLVMINTSQNPALFFWLTLGTVVLLNMANGIYNNSIFGMASKLPPKYIGAVILGTNLSGTFTSITSLVSLALTPDDRTAAIYYFATALIVLLACFFTYFRLPMNKFYKYHEMVYQEQIDNQQSNENGEDRIIIPYWNIFKQTFPQLFNVFFIFFVTLSIFPTVYSDIKPSDSNFFINNKYYVGFLCFLTFNFTALIGTYLSTFQTKWPQPKTLFIPVIIRVVFIPLFLFCNYHPVGMTRTMPVLIQNDYILWILGTFLGLSSGYFSSLAMMYIPSCVELKYSGIAGMFGAAVLLTGICCGILFGMLMPVIVENISW